MDDGKKRSYNQKTTTPQPPKRQKGNSGGSLGLHPSPPLLDDLVVDWVSSDEDVPAVGPDELEDFVREFGQHGGLGMGHTIPVPTPKAQDKHQPEGSENEDQGASVMCGMCFSGENEGCERASKRLSCSVCSKKYHKTCIDNWAQHRDLFHWSSWACPSCRTCEKCGKGDNPTKLMFCKRCDGAHHCYCQQPPHENVASGPYLCPKHTKCYSCASTVPGNALTARWYIGYNYCDDCGQLFEKGHYCPVCLKVYRDSDDKMVCCDYCFGWVHCQCDGISDEKYHQYTEEDEESIYKCPVCRGECYKLQGDDDTIQELWRRRDNVDQELMATLRAGAGLPSEDEIVSPSKAQDQPQQQQQLMQYLSSYKGAVSDGRKSVSEALKYISSSSSSLDEAETYGNLLESEIKRLFPDKPE